MYERGQISLAELHEDIFFYVKRPKRNNIHFMAVKMLYLKIIPRARMGSESIAHEAEGRTGY